MRKLGTLSSLNNLTQFDDISILDDERQGEFVCIQCTVHLLLVFLFICTPHMVYT